MEELGIFMCRIYLFLLDLRHAFFLGVLSYQNVSNAAVGVLQKFSPCLLWLSFVMQLKIKFKYICFLFI